MRIANPLQANNWFVGVLIHLKYAKAKKYAGPRLSSSCGWVAGWVTYQREADRGFFAITKGRWSLCHQSIEVKLENWDCSWLKVEWKPHRNISLTSGLGRRILKDSNWIQAYPLQGERMYMKLCRNRLGIIRMWAVICRTRSKKFLNR